MKIFSMICSLLLLVSCSHKTPVQEISIKKVETYALCGSLKPVDAEPLDLNNPDLKNIEILITNLQKYKNFEMQALKIVECYENQTKKK